MTRLELLKEITGLAGPILKQMEAQGIVVEQRAKVVFMEHFARQWRQLPDVERKDSA